MTRLVVSNPILKGYEHARGFYMYIYILIAGLFLTSCGSNIINDHIERKDVVDRRTPKVEKEFRSHVEKFESIYGVDVRILIEWDILEDNIMGVCYSWSDGYREIKIDSVKWGELTKNGQEQLIFHELGHCFFNLGHNENLIDMGRWTNIPESTMYPYIFGDDTYYDEFRDYYYDELVGQ